MDLLANWRAFRQYSEIPLPICIQKEMLNMKMVKKSLLAVASFLLVPIAASAGLLDSILGPVLPGGDAPAAPVPEPSGALLMGLALTAVTLAARRRNR